MHALKGDEQLNNSLDAKLQSLNWYGIREL